MAEIQNILEIQPNKISKDLTSYNFLFYSKPGVGKTTLAVKMFPKHFIIGAEYGFKGIPGALGVPVPDYYSLSQYVNQLDTDAAREKFDTIIVDTTTKIGKMLEEYILSQYGKNFMGDCKQHGGAYPLIDRYYDLVFNRLKARGYNFVYICHANEIEVKDSDGVFQYYRYTPKMSDRMRNLIEPEVDYIWYVGKDDNAADNENRFVITDATIKNEGKSRTNLPIKVIINDGAVNLKDLLIKGILEKGGDMITEDRAKTTVVQGNYEERDYREVISSINALGQELVNLNKSAQAMEIVNNGLGTDSNGVQRTLASMTQLNYQVLIKIETDLKALKDS